MGDFIYGFPLKNYILAPLRLANSFKYEQALQRECITTKILKILVPLRLDLFLRKPYSYIKKNLRDKYIYICQ